MRHIRIVPIYQNTFEEIKTKLAIDLILRWEIIF